MGGESWSRNYESYWGGKRKRKERGMKAGEKIGPSNQGNKNEIASKKPG